MIPISNKQKLLIKFPTRSRKDKFFNVLDLYYKNIEDLDNTRFIITCDKDDKEMNNDKVEDKLLNYKNLSVYYSDNKTKIEAINTDLEDEDFDILLVASDDMIPQKFGFDNIIRTQMSINFPNNDGVLWFNDGYQRSNLNTLPILGKKYYDKFNYIYHPSYKSLWCDNEFMEVANKLKKQVYIDDVIIKHEHQVWTGEKWDNLQVINDSFNNEDKNNYLRRKKHNFGIR